ncbi:uncharacterized protein TNCV_3634291 [Trichonephila clavipes]|nr:uncharacterized protein TNCV_3634291 [Trichonephila clavipes]
MASAVLADPTRALQGTNRGSGQAMEESENDVGSLEQLLLYTDEHYLAGKLPLEDHLGKVLHGVEEYHQRNVGPLRLHASQLKWTGYHRLWPPRPLHQLCGQCDVEQCGGELYRSPGRLHTRTRLSSVPKTNRDSSLNTTFCQSVTFHIDLAWHYCRRSCRCSGVKGSAWKGCLDLRFAFARCLEIVCGTIATPTSARIIERVTVGFTSACRTILRSSLLVVFLVVIFKVSLSIRTTVPKVTYFEGENLDVYFIWTNGEKKHQRQSISLETKIPILDRLGKGEASTAIGEHFNLGESTVRAIKKNEAAIRNSVISGTKLSTKFALYTKDVLFERTERAIAIWIEEQVQRRIPVSGYLIQEKALQFYKSMKQSEPSTSTYQAEKKFSASKGRLTGFLKRNALHNIKITGQRAQQMKEQQKYFQRS